MIALCLLVHASATDMGYKTIVLTSALDGVARDVAKSLVDKAVEIAGAHSGERHVSL